MSFIDSLRALKRTFQQRKFRASNKIGNNVTVAPSAILKGTILNDYSRVALGASVQSSSIGEYTAIGRYTKVTHTKIGKFCAISWDCTINAISHSHENLTISAFPYVPYVGDFVTERNQSYKEVEIGNDVWIGANAVIMPGVVLGDGAVIGAGAVVTRDVPPYAIVAGVPARVIRFRFCESVISRLMDIQWWNLDRSAIKKNIQLFQGPLDDIKLAKLDGILK